MGNWLTSEEKILYQIVSDTQTLANTINFALDSAFPFPEHAYAQNIFVGINIQRNELGLNPREKPGDIDYLIVPIKEQKLMLSKVIGIEAKIVRPTIKKPSKNANSIGGKQVKGLLRDGFPFVGLLHISVPEPLPFQMHTRIPMVSNKLGSNGKLEKTGKSIPIDMFPVIHAARHEGRLLSLNLPNPIAYKVISFNLSLDGKSFSGNTVGESRKGYQNPYVSKELLSNVESLLQKKPNLFQKIVWFNRTRS